MDESAEWRQRFDAEVEKTSTCYKDLSEVSVFHRVNSLCFIEKYSLLQESWFILNGARLVYVVFNCK